MGVVYFCSSAAFLSMVSSFFRLIFSLSFLLL